VFLFALFVGVCQLSANPSNTFAVEPFMLVSIANHTFYIGLWDPEPPYRLRWEIDFRRRFAVMAMWLSFTFFETWYWWRGFWQMKLSNGPIGTVIFFPYVGNTPLFGPDQWISIAAKVINAVLIVLLSMVTASLCCTTVLQRRLDRLINAERLKHLGQRWAKAFGVTVPESTNHELSTISDQADSRISEYSSVTLEAKPNQMKTPSDSVAESINLPPYLSPVRTGTGLLKRGLWRHVSNKDVDLSLPPPEYILYEPTFNQLNTAYDLLRASTECPKDKKGGPFKGATFLIMWFYPFYWFADILWYLCVQLRHSWRPSVLFAIKSHLSAIRFGSELTYWKCFRLALRHPKYCEVRSKDVALASRIILSTEPIAKPSRVWRFFLAWGMLGACSILIISTELTIQWNKIQDVQNLSSVGQLIPFTLGVGSLMKIVWSAVADRDKKADEFCYYDHCVNAGVRIAWQEAARSFLRAREAAQKCKVMTGGEEGKEKCGDDTC
jgi:hypothetical protein